MPTRQEALALDSDLKVLEVGESRLLEEPPLDSEKLRNGDSFLRRGHTLSGWLNAESGMLVTTPGALVTPFRFGKAGLTLAAGARLGRDALASWLAENGYRRAELVWQPGEFAVRGGIVDFFDPSEKAPLRVEFFDEDVESIRFFQPRSQRSFQNLPHFIVRSVNHSEDEQRERSWGNYGTLLVQPRRLEDSFAAFCELYNALVEEKQRLAPDAFERFLLDTGRLPRLRVSAPGEGVHQDTLDFGAVPYFRGDLRAARAYVDSHLRAGFKIHIASRNLTGSSFPEQVSFQRGSSLSGGVVVKDRNEIWISDAELFGINEVAEEEINRGMPLDLEASLKKDQWVIHEKYGVCQLEGTSVENFGGQDYETIVLRFADNERLIIPTAELFRLTPWNGNGVPEFDSLKSKRWRSAWKKAEAQIEAEAQGLLNLYAQRELADGRAFGRDGDLLKRFEESFPYKETVDQLRAIRDVKHDMERRWPMDRLIVGDVGYGKTEVVLRAAVKTVENGAQAAIIAPTTVLALQHYRTCVARVGELPIRVELISRMNPNKKQK